MSRLLASGATLVTLLFVASIAEVAAARRDGDPMPADDRDGAYFRPPSIPFATFGPMQQKHILATTSAATLFTRGASTRYWLGQDMPIGLALRLGTHTVALVGGDAWPTTSSGAELDARCGLESLANVSAWFAVQPDAADVGPLITRLDYDVYRVDLTSWCSARQRQRRSYSRHADSNELHVHLREGGGDLMARVVVETVHTMDSANLDLLTRPLVYINVSVERVALPADTPVVAYLDFAAQNAIHLFEQANHSEPVVWVTGRTPSAQVPWVALGTSEQPVLETCGDLFMLDWGYGMVGAMPQTNNNVSVTAGLSMNTTRSIFSAEGKLEEEAVPPRMAFNIFTGDVVVSAVTVDISLTGSAVFFVGYDAGPIVSYFGEHVVPRWSQQGKLTFLDMLDAAGANYVNEIDMCRAVDARLTSEWTAALGGRYRRVASLAYRQTIAAIELGHSTVMGNVAFLKEISTDGDINTMDVIFPASPLFLWAMPDVLKQLLIPVLRFAANETVHPYSSPYSPHQLGIYPIANATTASQEVMPLENTGNMIVMLHKYLQLRPEDPFFFTPRPNSTEAFNPYWGVLSKWIDYMMTTQLPDPPRQTTTDDFAGPLNHDVNLAGKGIIAVHSFGEMCKMVAGDVNPANGRPCSDYAAAAARFAEYWVEHATNVDVQTGLNFTKLAYDRNGTWSTKYNLVWQRLLKNQSSTAAKPSLFGARPFATMDVIAANEIELYRVRNNEFGYPLDSRHSYQKLDWLSWGACLCRTKTCFNGLFDGVYRMANQTVDRFPLTDLYNTHHATIVYSFVSRPVVGAIFMPLMLDWEE